MRPTSFAASAPKTTSLAEAAYELLDRYEPRATSGFTASKYCDDTPTKRAVTRVSSVAMVPSFCACMNITDTPSSSASALASNSLKASGAMAVMFSWLVPRVASDLLIPCEAPSTIEVSATIAATPITTPSMVNRDLTLVAQILFSARVAVPSNLNSHLAHHVRSAHRAKRLFLARWLRFLNRG